MSCITSKKHLKSKISYSIIGKKTNTGFFFLPDIWGKYAPSFRVVNDDLIRVAMRKSCWRIPVTRSPSARSTLGFQTSGFSLCAVLSHPSLLELHARYGQPPWGLCVSSNPGCALGAVGYPGAVDVVMWIRCPEENIINHQYESGHRHAEEIDNRHRHFHPNLS